MIKVCCAISVGSFINGVNTVILVLWTISFCVTGLKIHNSTQIWLKLKVH